MVAVTMMPAMTMVAAVAVTMMTSMPAARRSRGHGGGAERDRGDDRE